MVYLDAASTPLRRVRGAPMPLDAKVQQYGRSLRYPLISKKLLALDVSFLFLRQGPYPDLR